MSKRKFLYNIIIYVQKKKVLSKNYFIINNIFNL